MNRGKKKIAIVSDSVYPYNMGGKEKRLHDITTRLAADGHDVTIYCMKWWEGEKTITQDGVTLYAISPYYPLYSNERRSIKEGIFFALHCLKLIGRSFDVIEIDHIPHLVLFTMKVVCVLKRKKMIVTWHEVWGLSYWQKYLGTVKGFIAYSIEKITVMLPDIIASVSEHTTNDLRTILGSKKTIVTIPNGLNLEVIKSAEMSKQASDIIFVGRLLSHKNVDVLLNAIEILKKKDPNISLLVVGEGPEKENLEKLNVDLKITSNVSFLGFIEDHKELYSLIKASKVFVLPSTREGFGIAVIEANACGLPVITIDNDHNGARELIINNENGMVCALDKDTLADTIEKALNDKKDPAFYMKYAEKYNWDQIFLKIEELFNI